MPHPPLTGHICIADPFPIFVQFRSREHSYASPESYFSTKQYVPPRFLPFASSLRVPRLTLPHPPSFIPLLPFPLPLPLSRPPPSPSPA